MAKTKERQVAEKMFIDFHKSQKEIAEELGLTEKTVSNWVNKHAWKQRRDAKLNNTSTRSENIKKVIGELTECSLENMKRIREAEARNDQAEVLDLKKESTRISQEIGMYQKALEKIEKDFKVSLSTYLEVMEEIFQALQSHDKDVYLKTIDFQKTHIQNVAQKLG